MVSLCVVTDMYYMMGLHLQTRGNTLCSAQEVDSRFLAFTLTAGKPKSELMCLYGMYFSCAMEI